MIEFKIWREDREAYINGRRFYAENSLDAQRVATNYYKKLDIDFSSVYDFTLKNTSGERKVRRIEIVKI
jgi:hypothetical protein